MREARRAADAGPRPDCECHGVPMRWNARRDLIAGGYWRCSVADRERHRLWRATHREERRLKMREWRDANREHRRSYQRHWRYGIDAATYAALVERQDGRCALCDIRAEDAPKGALHIDHDHVSGRIRGLICLRCNSALERVELEGWSERVASYLGHR